VFLSYNDNNDDHGIRQANTTQALIRWQCLGASHEATDKLHWAMCLTPYEPGGKVIAFAVDFIKFFYIADNRLPKN
jgi:hypothetical protein